MTYKEFLTTALFKDSDCIDIQNKNKEIQDIKNYKKIRNKTILDYEVSIVDDLVITTLTMDI
jgi:hypothetical protein